MWVNWQLEDTEENKGEITVQQMTIYFVVGYRMVVIGKVNWWVLVVGGVSWMIDVLVDCTLVSPGVWRCVSSVDASLSSETPMD